MAAQDDLQGTAPLELSHRICLTGEAVVDFSGELDSTTAEAAVSYVSDLVDRHRGPMIADVTALAFCDARGLAALARMADYAEQKGCPFGGAGPRPLVVRRVWGSALD
jgi:anti-anti-sigma factor